MCLFVSVRMEDPLWRSLYRFSINLTKSSLFSSVAVQQICFTCQIVKKCWMTFHNGESRVSIHHVTYLSNRRAIIMVVYVVMNEMNDVATVDVDFIFIEILQDIRSCS